LIKGVIDFIIRNSRLLLRLSAQTLPSLQNSLGDPAIYARAAHRSSYAIDTNFPAIDAATLIKRKLNFPHI
jgi:hypothetical protein